MKIRRVFFPILSLLLIPNLLFAQRPLIIDHDGAIDDIIATALQILHAPESIKAITIVPADCYLHPAVWIVEQLKTHFLPAGYNIPIGISTNEGINPFPGPWREHAYMMARIPLWDDAISLNNFSMTHLPAAKNVVAQVLQEATIPIDILVTGPCTNIAEVLREYPELSEKINRIVIMGGALYIKGNVEEPGHDGSAEWNIYNNPEAFRVVLHSGVPITLVPLDATQYTPIRKEFMSKLSHHRGKKQCQLISESLQTIIPMIESGEYLFWDTLTSAILINPSIVRTKKIAINVVLQGPSMGRIMEDSCGIAIDVAVWADQQLFEETVLQVLLKAE